MLQKYIKKLVVITLLSTSLTVLSTGLAYAETYGQVTVTASILNLRESPSTSSKIIGTLKKGSRLKVQQSSGEWYKVSTDKLNGWVSVKYVTEANTSNTYTSENNSTTNTTPEATTVLYGKITGNNVNVRKGPGLTYSVIKQLNKGELIEILEKKDKWYKVRLSDNVVAWVSSSYILECKETTEQIKENDSEKASDKVSEKESDISQSSSSGEQGSQSETSESTNNSKFTASETSASQTSEEGTADSTMESTDESTVVISDLIDLAQSLVGVKYTYGGTSPETGFDCSGFTQYVFGSFGIKLERVAADQAKQGVEVKQEELLPGDLVFSDTDGGNNNINHVGIYIGDGKFISATSGSNSAKVSVTSLESSYWKSTYMTARRIV